MLLIINLIAYYTLVKTEVKRLSRIALQTILPPVITTSLYYLIFGTIIGSRVGMMDGVPYIVYIAPGLIIMNIITNSYANVVTTFFQARFMRHVEEILTSPIFNITMLLGYVSGGVIRGLTVAFFVGLVSKFFTHMHIYSFGLVLLVSLLAAILMSLLGFINGLFARSFDETTIVTTFVLTPFTYLGGIFFSIDVLPEFWQQVALFNPLLYIVNSFRYAVTGVTDIDPYQSILVVAGFCIVLFAANLYLLKKGVGIKS